jgi:exopolysaccharide production protein ExoZ
MKNYIQNLNLLRFISVSLVIFYHTQIFNLHLGRFGVDIFITLSGFLITKSLYERTRNEFIISRLAKILPSYFFITISIVLIHSIYPELIESNYITHSEIIKSLLFVPYINKAGNYSPILPVGWSLNFEIMFYIVAFLSFLISRKKYFYILSLSLILIWIFSSQASEEIIRFYANSIIFEFLLGSLIYYLPNIQLKNGYFFLLSAISFILALISESYFLETNRFAFFGVISFLIVYLFKSSESKTRPIGVIKKVLSELGAASYSIYLTHYFVIKLLKILFGLSTLVSLISYVTSICIGYIFYILFEKFLYIKIKKLCVKHIK